MDGSRFDDLLRALTESRRAFLGGTLALAAGWLGVGDGAANRKSKNKKKKPKPNAYGCLSVGKTCKSADQCCSGICEGKKGKRTCRAHDAGTCTQDMPGVCAAPDVALMTCNNRSDCGCFRTTAGSTFCADLNGRQCVACQRDADCVALGLPPASSCVPVSEGHCAGICTNGMACMVPCGVDLPELEPELAGTRALPLHSGIPPRR